MKAITLVILAKVSEMIEVDLDLNENLHLTIFRVAECADSVIYTASCGMSLVWLGAVIQFRILSARPRDLSRAEPLRLQREQQK